MSNSKTFLNVPYAQKDEAKILGAKWDAGKKNWYIPSGLDPSPFNKWNKETSQSPSPSLKKKSGFSQGTITHPKDNNFVPYKGELPPWN